jgi:hypothetical protein
VGGSEQKGSARNQQPTARPVIFPRAGDGSSNRDTQGWRATTSSSRRRAISPSQASCRILLHPDLLLLPLFLRRWARRPRPGVAIVTEVLLLLLVMGAGLGLVMPPAKRRATTDSVGRTEVFVSAGPLRSQLWGPPLVPDRWRSVSLARLAPSRCRHLSSGRRGLLLLLLLLSRGCPSRCSSTSWASSTSTTCSRRLGYGSHYPVVLILECVNVSC